MNSLQFHRAQGRGAAQHGRGLQFAKQRLLVTVASRDIELQADMLAGASAELILHHAMLTLEDAVDLLRDLFQAGAGDLVSDKQGFQIESQFQMAEREQRYQD